jgi:hypothetical protein
MGTFHRCHINDLPALQLAQRAALQTFPWLPYADIPGESIDALEAEQ